MSERSQPEGKGLILGGSLVVLGASVAFAGFKYFSRSPRSLKERGEHKEDEQQQQQQQQQQSSTSSSLHPDVYIFPPDSSLSALPSSPPPSHLTPLSSPLSSTPSASAFSSCSCSSPLTSSSCSSSLRLPSSSSSFSPFKSVSPKSSSSSSSSSKKALSVSPSVSPTATSFSCASYSCSCMSSSSPSSSSSSFSSSSSSSQSPSSSSSSSSSASSSSSFRSAYSSSPSFSSSSASSFSSSYASLPSKPPPRLHAGETSLDSEPSSNYGASDADKKREALRLSKLAAARHGNGEYREALNLFTRALALHQHFKYYTNRALTAIQESMYDEALADARASIAIKPTPKGHHAMGSALMGLRRYEEAVKDFEKVFQFPQVEARDIKLSSKLIVECQAKIAKRRRKQEKARAIKDPPPPYASSESLESPRTPEGSGILVGIPEADEPVSIRTGKANLS